MYDVVVDLIEFNESINFRFIVAGVLLYLFILWLIIVLWVYFDAKKRFTSEIQPSIMAFGTLFLGFPFLIFYLLIRPDRDENVLAWEEDNNPGVNIPVINFTGKEGVEMTLNLSIHPKVKDARPSDIKVGVSIEPDDDKFEIEELHDLEEEAGRMEEVYGESSLVDNFKKGVSKIRSIVRRRMGFFMKTNSQKNISSVESTEEVYKKKKKKKKKKHRRN
jgi:hypothetical protein